MIKGRKVIITLSGDRPIEDVAKDLSVAGLEGGQVLDEIGIITGSADDNMVPNLRKIRGIADISSDISIDVGPPDSQETW